MLREANGAEEVISEGLLVCSACAAQYDIVQGIPVLLVAESSEGQAAEQETRQQGAQGFHGSGCDELLREVSRHHYIPAMRRAAHSFAHSFDEDQWILDAGAGWAWHWLDEQNPQIIAMDFSLPMLLVAQRLLSQQVDNNVHLVCADATELPLKGSSVDGIWSVQMLQHLPGEKLDLCLRRWAEARRDGAPVEVYWINWSVLDLVLSRLVGKQWPKERTEPYYFKMTTSEELLNLLHRSFGGTVSVAYNEIVFHPELRLTHRLALGWLDHVLGRIPLINRWFARQVVGRIRRPGQRQSARLSGVRK